MQTVRLTTAQALIRFLIAQRVRTAEGELPLFAGVFAIFGHGNVAGLGEALYSVQDRLPTFRAHNEQGMAHSAIAYAKARNRQQMMACTTSIGPGATNMVTAAALAHVNRLPVLLLPGDVFASRRPDPVLQQIEDFGDPNLVANDCFKPVSRYWDRISRPEQIISSLPHAMRVLTDPADCGPVTICLPQDTQAESHDFPGSLFGTKVHELRRQAPDQNELARAIDILSASESPLIIAGGGVIYSEAADSLAEFALKNEIPVAETQAGKGSLPWNHPCNAGAIGVTGSTAANRLAHDADVVLAIGTRLTDFTTGSRSLFQNENCKVISLNVAAFDATKHGCHALVGDARTTLQLLNLAGNEHSSRMAWFQQATELASSWNKQRDDAVRKDKTSLPTDAQVLGAVNAITSPNDTVVCAAGGLPGELHKLWRTDEPGGYHVEYGYSCMGYEIAGGLGVKIAKPDSTVFVLVGDGSYLMLNSEIATSILMDKPLVVVVLDNGGFGCISRLQRASGGDDFNNLHNLGTRTDGDRPLIDFAAHARSLGAISKKVGGLSELNDSLIEAVGNDRTTVLVIDTDPLASTEDGGHWWDVAIPETSENDSVAEAYESYLRQRTNQRTD